MLWVHSFWGSLFCLLNMCFTTVLFIFCEAGYVCPDACVEVRENFWGSVLSFCCGLVGAELRSLGVATVWTASPAPLVYTSLLSLIQSHFMCFCITNYLRLRGLKATVIIWQLQLKTVQEKVSGLGSRPLVRLKSRC